MAVEVQAVGQVSGKLDNMKIDAHRKVVEVPEVPGTKEISSRQEQQTNPPLVIESYKSSGSIASSEATGDATSSYGSRDEYTDVAFIAPPNGFFPPQGTFYAGSPVPVMNMQGYIPYSIEGVQYHSPVVDYNFVTQPCFGSLSSGLQYPANEYNGYVYGPPLYPYPPQPYYQQTPGGQYLLAPPSIPAGGVMLLESQDPGQLGMIMPSGFTNINAYAGGLPTPGFQMPMVPPPVHCEKGAVPVAVTYVPSHTLRASAPAWIEASTGVQKQGKPAESQPGVPVPCAPTDTVQSRKSSSSLNPPVASSTTAPKSGAPPADVTASHSISETPDQVVTPAGTDTKLNECLDDDGKQKMKGNGHVTSHNGSLKAQIEENKDLWASKVRGQQLVPALKNLKVSCGSPNKDLDTSLPNGERYNVTDFVAKYDDAKHFIIKSYSEENVHRSIQYNVWASTPNGNKKLDEAYQDAQRRAVGKPGGCPVFLFFSVNGSRQFCGVAEMTGPVDYSRTMNFWEQHKWSGSFPIKWHIIKDVPNSQLRRIILENNENKPVTNSRDTQDVNFHQGLEMLNIFKSYPLRTSILDDFPMFLSPQKVVQEVKPLQWSPQCFPRIGEQVGKEREESDVGPKTAKLNLTPSNTLDNGPRLKEPNCLEKCDAKPLLGKVVETPGPDVRVDKEKFKREKENMKVPSKEERVMVSF